MSSTKTKQQKFGDTHPIGQLLDDWIAWVEKNEKGKLTVNYDGDEDIFTVYRNGRKAVLYTSDIDEDFYGEDQALFVESEIGEPPENLDWSQTLKFSGNELVLSRISLTGRHSKTILLIEAACPISTIEYPSFDLMVKEVATIGRDLRQHLSGVMDVDEEWDEDDEDDEEEDDEDEDDEDEDEDEDE
jgi:hypothetical protein